MRRRRREELRVIAEVEAKLVESVLISPLSQLGNWAKQVALEMQETEDKLFLEAIESMGIPKEYM